LIPSRAQTYIRSRRVLHIRHLPLLHCLFRAIRSLICESKCWRCFVAGIDPLSSLPAWRAGFAQVPYSFRVPPGSPFPSSGVNSCPPQHAGSGCAEDFLWLIFGPFFFLLDRLPLLTNRRPFQTPVPAGLCVLFVVVGSPLAGPFSRDTWISPIWSLLVYYFFSCLSSPCFFVPPSRGFLIPVKRLAGLFLAIRLFEVAVLFAVGRSSLRPGRSIGGVFPSAL